MKPGFNFKVFFVLVIWVCATVNGWTRETAPTPTSEQILAHTAESTASILTGEGAGRLSSLASGVIVRGDGVILTAYHVVKNAREIQVRLKNGGRPKLS